ncbi:hypothetical protein SPF06_14755 [Sinomonas sp. JGH33]|uniref:Major facilitator superfamily (MFS) profile domain-containing protein n=1 Tax=Sinomonas terricola TaxID=3110330 RepID=A0ABU5T8T0_9MICC|nr:hypothetical protein [Sinomonas sp. JGH33]MEA5455993.1 hypothetical protein [Sinomonas sp. JGH33]
MLLSAALAVFALDARIAFGVLIAMGLFYLGQFQSTANGLAVLNAPEDAPGSLPGINGACFGLGASTGIAMVAPLVNLGTAAGYQAALWVSAGLAAAGLVSALILRPTTHSMPAKALVIKGHA